jgi:cell filamentation protein
MTDGGYDAFEDPYCYKGTSVLKNRLGTRDATTLQAFEVEISALRAEEPLPAGRLGAAHYRAVHHHLFQDVYPWAGRYRTVRTSKGGNMFCYPEHIRAQMERVFRQLKEDDFLRGRSFEGFMDGAAVFLSELNAIHPFREGNGRAQLSFLHLLSIKAGHPLELAKIRPAEFLAAMIASFNGNLRPLIAELTRLRA